MKHEYSIKGKRLTMTMKEIIAKFRKATKKEIKRYEQAVVEDEI